MTKPAQNKKEKSVSWWKKKAWECFSLKYRLEHTNQAGYGKCYTCDAILFYKKAQAGHAVGGRSNAILFYEPAIRLQCPQCNIFKHGNYGIFHERLEKECGFGILQELLKVSRQIVQYRIPELKLKVEEYKQISEKLLYEKGFKK